MTKGQDVARPDRDLLSVGEEVKIFRTVTDIETEGTKSEDRTYT
jgi:hypothetical protein